jgi:hypothetical protein
MMAALNVAMQHRSGGFMRILVLLFAVSLTLSAQTKPQVASAAAPKQASSATDVESVAGHLPVMRVVLYKNGIGYFEHSGHVRGNQEVNIDFTTSQLDDVLKSLTVVDLGEGRVTGVRYNSIAPLDQRLRGLRLPLGTDPTREQLLDALRGARVDVRNGSATATGKILSVEVSKRENERTDETTEVMTLSLVTDAGELRTFELTPATSVRILDRDLNEELNRYFTMVGSSRAKDVRRMTIATSGAGERELLVSYVSEVPVWKTTYRIVIPTDPSRKPLLQGWAVVDNTVGEDWKNVKLSLVAGAPQSFIQQISTPLYARRPVVPLPQTAQLSPQTYEGAIEEDKDMAAAAAPPPPPSSGPIGGLTSGRDRLSYRKLSGACALSGTVVDPSGAVVPNANISMSNTSGTSRAYTDSSGSFCMTNVSGGPWTFKAEAQGFNPYVVNGVRVSRNGIRINPTLQVGSVSESVEVSAGNVVVENGPIEGREFNRLVSTSPAASNVMMEQQFQSAGGREIGDLFSYDIKQPITIGKDQSALVPIVQARIDSEKVTIWNDHDVPRRALWIRNTSGETLDSGSFTIVEGDSFAGEGLIDPIKPNDRRLLSYAADQAIRVKSTDDYHDQPISHVKILRGVMTVTRQARTKRTYEVHNADTQERHVVVEHPARDGWKLAEGVKPEETTASVHRFLVDVKPNETSKLEVTEFHPEDSTIMLSNINNDLILYYANEKVLESETQHALRRIVDQQSQIADYNNQIYTRQQEVNNIGNDQARVRENMKALKGSAEEKALVQRYASEMNSQEDRLATLRTEIASLQQKLNEARAELDKMVMAVDVDDKF